MNTTDPKEGVEETPTADPSATPEVPSVEEETPEENFNEDAQVEDSQEPPVEAE